MEKLSEIKSGNGVHSDLYIPLKSGPIRATVDRWNNEKTKQNKIECLVKSEFQISYECLLNISMSQTLNGTYLH